MFCLNQNWTKSSYTTLNKYIKATTYHHALLYCSSNSLGALAEIKTQRQSTTAINQMQGYTMQRRKGQQSEGMERNYSSDLSNFNYCIKILSLKAMKVNYKILILTMLLLRESHTGFPVLYRRPLTTVVSKTILSRLF